MDGGHQARVCLAQLLTLPELPVAQMLEGVDYHSPIRQDIEPQLAPDA